MRHELNNLSLRQLRAFEAIARLGSFAAAASEQCVTQSALSESIKQLESTVGLRLLDRTTRHVALSAAGELFIDDVRQVLATLRNAQQRLLELRTLANGHVRLAAAPSVLASLVVPAMDRLMRERPGVRVTLRDETGERIVQLVQGGEVDFGIGGLPAGVEGLARQRLLADRFGLVAPLGHPLLARDNLKLSDLKDEVFVGLTEDTAIAQMIARVPRCPENLLQHLARASNPALMRQMIDAGMGVGLLPALVTMGPDYRGLGFNPLRAGASHALEREIYMLQRPNRTLAPAADALWQGIQQATSSLVGRPGLQIA